MATLKTAITISNEDSDSTSECGSVGSSTSLVQTFFWEKTTALFSMIKHRLGSASYRTRQSGSGNAVSLSWRAKPSLVPRPPPLPSESVREGLGMRLCHASATPQLLTCGRTMRRGAPLLPSKRRKDEWDYSWMQFVAGVIPTHFRIVVRDPPIR